MFKDIGVSVQKHALTFVCLRSSLFVVPLWWVWEAEEKQFLLGSLERHGWEWSGGRDMHMVSPISIDLFEYPRVLLLSHSFPNCLCVTGIGMFQMPAQVWLLIVPYDFLLFSCIFTSMARSTLTYPLLSPILKNMSFTELQVAF
jgi:hypothetical protein